MATDEELNQAKTDCQEVWGPLHAWRALGQLKAIEAFKPILSLLDDEYDDWIRGDIPTLCTLIGLETVPLLRECLADTSNSMYNRAYIAEVLESMSREYPETRESNIAAIAQQLEKFEDNDTGFNGLLIASLVKLQAKETIDVIERAFQANQVDTLIVGNWEDVQVDFGLKAADEVSMPRKKILLTSLLSTTTRKTKTAKGFGSTEKNPKKKKSRKSSGKRKKK